MEVMDSLVVDHDHGVDEDDHDDGMGLEEMQMDGHPDGPRPAYLPAHITPGSRYEKSLGLLTTRFVALLQKAKDGVLDLKEVALQIVYISLVSFVYYCGLEFDAKMCLVGQGRRKAGFEYLW